MVPQGRGEIGPAGVAGPLRRAVTSDGSFVKGPDDRFRDDANALILMRRVAFVEGGAKVKLDKAAARTLLRWAVEENLGQQAALVESVGLRRAAALAALAKRGETVVRLRITPEWRLAVGLGNRANPHEMGLSLHGTYGWPVIPGSSVKGLTAAWTQPLVDAETVDPALFEAVFGTPRIRPIRPPRTPKEKPRRGSVRFLDAIPVGGPVTVTRDVVTPHVQPYYAAAGRDGEPVPPAEHHQPIPWEFLVISRGQFAVDLIGPAEDVAQAAVWCAAAFDDLGVGGKTGAGYGYATVTRGDT